MTLAVLDRRFCRCAEVGQSAPNFGAFREIFASATAGHRAGCTIEHPARIAYVWIRTVGS